MADAENSKQPKSSTVHSVVVAARLLEFLADSGRPQRVTDIALHLDMTKARVSRHLSTLSDLGLVARMPDKSGYRLGPTLFRLSNAALDQYEITNIAYRYMVVLRNKIQESILLAIPAGGDALIVSTVSSGKTISPSLPRGTRLSIPTSPSAEVILAFSEEFMRERVLARRSENVLTGSSQRSPGGEVIFSAAEQRARFEIVQRQFYAFAKDPHDSGFSVLSAPIFNHVERVDAALTLVTKQPSDPGSAERQYSRVLIESAIEISRALGSIEMANRMLAVLNK